jgi:predicted RNase H-like HicB family nuclease
MKLTIETDREEDGRWIAEAPELPGVLCYGATRPEAIAAAEALALRVIAEVLGHGEVRQRDEKGEPIHVLWGLAANTPDVATLITAYRPDPERWMEDWMTRRKR